MINNFLRYISLEEVINVYHKTIEMSGGGASGILEESKVKLILDFVKNDNYYPNFATKLNYLVFRFCTSHCLIDGNKRIALTLGVKFLLDNKYYWAATTFMKRMEAIVYHIAASHIDQELSLRIIQCIVDCRDFDESLKIDIAHAIDKDY